MRDLTTGPIWRHLLGMAAFIGLGLVVQTLYLLIDLYFVAHLGKQAVAGVATAGSSTFVVMAATQLVSVGALALISQAIGRRDEADAQLVFEQVTSLSLLAAGAVLIVGYGAGGAAVRALAADAATAAQARIYLYAFLPSLAALFPMSALGAALRASGVVGPPMLLQSVTVLLNAALAPILIVGWGTGHGLGVAGAGLASSVATLLGLIALGATFDRLQPRLRLDGRRLTPHPRVWRRIVKVGLPAASELFLLFIVTSTVYWAIRGFGAQAQAGFGIASRVSQSIFLPAMAVAFASAPIAGQNFGAGQAARVRSTFVHAAIIGSAVMFVLTLLCQLQPALLLRPFTEDRAVVAVGAEYLRYSSWNFVAVGLVFACSGLFQALGDTRPSLLSAGSRLATFVVPVLFLAKRPGVQLHDLWRLSVGSITLQAVASLLLLRHQLKVKLPRSGARAAVNTA